MNAHPCLIRELMIYEFKVGRGRNKKYCYAEGDGAIDHNAVTRWLKKFRFGCKNLDDQQVQSGLRPWILRLEEYHPGRICGKLNLTIQSGSSASRSWWPIWLGWGLPNTPTASRQVHKTSSTSGQVSWGGGCRIHWLHLCRGARLYLRVSWIWPKKIWCWGSKNVGALGNAEYPFITITRRSTLTQSGSTW